VLDEAGRLFLPSLAQYFSPSMTEAKSATQPNNLAVLVELAVSERETPETH
jgi:hypothetical protein